MKLLTCTALALLLLAAPAFADGRQGVAFVNALEQAHAHCFSNNADEAFACARRKCRAAGGEECLRVRWCYPAGWSGVMSINLEMGFHFPTELCGMPNRAAVIEGFRTMCRNWENVGQCHIGLIYSPGSDEEKVSIEIDPKG